jgi:hypothetical protein
MQGKHHSGQMAFASCSMQREPTSPIWMCRKRHCYAKPYMWHLHHRLGVYRLIKAKNFLGARESHRTR